MSVVAKVGSLLTQGVYSVATPFHPFGGAVDIIVVQQPDDSFRSTPWYVRFGKFQGVLKGWEKIVRINVNGVEANFHMYLDNSGEAYFIREVDSSHDSESQAGRDGAQGDNRFNKDIKENFPARRLQSSLSDPGVPREDFPSFRPDGLDRAESDACKFYDFQDEQSSLEGSVELSAEYGSNRFDNLDSAENFAEAQGPGSEMVLVSVDGHILMAPISSTEKQNTDDVELGTPQFHLGPGGSTEFCEGSRDFCVAESAWSAGYLTDLNAASSSKVNATDGSGADRQKEVSKGEADLCREQIADDAEGLKKCKEDQGSNNEQHEVDICEEVGKHIHQNQGTSNVEDPDRDLHVHNDVEDELAGGKTFERFQSCLKHKDFNQFSCQESLSAIQEELESPRESPQKGLEVSNDTESRNSGCLQSASDGEEQRVDEFQSNEEPQPPTPAADMEDPEAQNIATGVRNFGSEDTSVCDDDQSGVAQSVGAAQSRDRNDLEGECCASKIMEQKAGPVEEEQTSSGSRIEISLCGHLLRAGMGLSAAAEAFDVHRISKEEFKSSATSIIKSEKLIVRVRERYLTWDKAAPIVLGATAFDLDLPVEPGDVIPVQQEEKVNENDTGGVPTSGRKWRLWPIPFRSVKTLEHSNSSSSNEEVFVDPETPSQERSVERMSTSQNGTPSSDTGTKSSPRKKVVRTNIVTSEQIASLNLKDGQNIVTFSSTSLLGSQQVEAHIYLWKWNTRIVISDVDGTITKSDVLGQFMPLVGRDWSQSGVARLFCAIKENGYQLLFLSARAIVQAYLTKSFLFNLKQDGKTLPNGPVVISPDGLFPSLYREVIRRAPHEFKIACLEDIKALFPPDYNPFYAGFGNRDTDELSYRKIGIPKGKIFIINPKGEVAINNRVDVRSYTSLHTLVNDMFPPTSMVEQEDFNAWNFWRMPLPDIDD